MPQPALILFRSAAPDDPFVAEFKAAGWAVSNVPVLDFSYVNSAALQAQLRSAEGIIITSPRAATALVRVCAEDPNVRATCAQIDIVCTGKRTAASLVDIGFTPILSADADAAGVARHVIGMRRRHWLFLSGNLRRPELPALLSDAGVSFAELEVYETIPRTDLALEKLPVPDWVGFFSPSGVEIVKQSWPGGWAAVKKAAIGATTAEAMREANWAVDAVAEVPEAAALSRAIG